MGAQSCRARNEPLWSSKGPHYNGEDGGGDSGAPMALRVIKRSAFVHRGTLQLHRGGWINRELAPDPDAIFQAAFAVALFMIFRLPT